MAQKIIKIGVIADTHIPDRAQSLPEEVLKEFKNVDMIIHAGDLVDLGVLETLKSACPNIKAVWGNMDPYEVRKKLPEKEILEVENYKIGIMHGYGPPGNLIELLSGIFKDEGVNIVIFGHAHNPVNQEKEGVLYFNPGSPTDKFFSKFNSFGIIEISDKIEGKIIKI